MAFLFEKFLCLETSLTRQRIDCDLIRFINIFDLLFATNVLTNPGHQ